MLLLFHTKSRLIRKSVLILFLLVGALRTACSAPPQILSAGGQCPLMVITWTSSGQVPFYLIILFGPNGPSTQIAMNTQASFFDLVPGNYNAMVRAGNDSTFSPMFPFTVGPCVTCVQPTVNVSNVSPSTLWPPNGRSIPVHFAGSVTGITSSCPLTQATYTVSDSQGNPSQGQVSVASDGTFKVTLSLEASRLGDDPAGRVYTFTVNVANKGGTATSNPVQVNVPHDQGH
jgi:hypothetical protein